MGKTTNLVRVPDDRFANVWLEGPVRTGSPAEGDPSSSVQGDDQPLYKMKPNTGRFRRGTK